MKEKYTLSIFSENKIGLLHSITAIFTRRKISIDSLNTSESEVKGVYRYTLVVTTTEDMVEKIARQIERLIEILGVYVHKDDDIIHREVALYKVPTDAFYNGNILEQLIRRHNARIIRLEKDYLVIEKTGWKSETQSLLHELEPYGILEFVRSGRVAVSKAFLELHQKLNDLEKIEKEIV